METILVLGDLEFPLGSGRGITQTLAHLSSAVSLRRTINGDMVDISAPQFRKYTSTVSCTDQAAPTLNDVWPGMPLSVDCIVELSYPTGGSPARDVVTGSSRTEGAVTFYRPRLDMVVTGYTVNTDEWGATVSWTCTLEEI